MKKISGIYKIENLIDHNIYIGQSSDLKRRKIDHFKSLRGNYHYNKHLQRAWNKYGEINFKFTIIEKCECKLLGEREIYWIKYYDSMNKGYNQCAGGDSPNLGVPEKTETIEKIRNTLLKKYSNGELVSKKRKPVICLNTLEVFDCVNCKSNKYKISNTQINKCCLGKMKTAGELNDIGLVWMYYQDYLNQKNNLDIDKIIQDANNIRKQQGIYSKVAIKVICLNNMQIYDSMVIASQETNANKDRICQCCRGNCKSAGKDKITGLNLKWMYYDDYLNSKDILNIRELINTANSVNYKDGRTKPINRKIMCINTGEIFSTAISASQSYNTDSSCILKCCKGERKSAGKLNGDSLHWAFYEDYINNQAKAC